MFFKKILARLTGHCPECGTQMRYWVDPRVPAIVAEGEDPGDLGCDEDCWMCYSCKKEFPLLYVVSNGR
jgi:uncharacterized protein with PIN domain